MSTQPTAQQPSMHLAEILSDLVSLRVCDPTAAQTLVSTRPTTSTTNDAQPEETDDVELTRAKELLRLHYEVKEAQKRGELGRGLEGARREVEGALGRG
ncbi:hypothetical protein NX059_004061 [Plenodomus lindquistii]|nr:hypothetical protein NX059_004061 [Plenodomus lindquistii]